MVLTRRIIINLVVFAVLFAVLCAWALTNVLGAQPFSPPYPLHAEFTDASGLRPGFEVGYLGTHIGRVGAVQLGAGAVHVTFDVDRGREVPVGSTAVVQRKSAVGEPFLNILPPPGAADRGPFMRPGDTIPLGSTRPALSYSDLLNAFQRMLGAVPPQDLHTVVHELSIALNGQGPAIRTIITESDELFRTAAAHTATFDASIAELSRLAHLMADHRQAIGTGLDDGATFVDTLTHARGSIDALLQNGPTVTDQVASLLAGSIGSLDCTMGSLGAVFTDLGTPSMADAMRRTMDITPTAAQVLRTVTDTDPSGLWLRTMSTLNLGTPPVPAYPQRRAIPGAPTVPPCRSSLEPVAATAGTASVAPVGSGGQAAGLRPGAGGALGPGGSGGPGANRHPGGGHGWLPFLLAVLALLAAGAAAAKARQRHRAATTAPIPEEGP